MSESWREGRMLERAEISAWRLAKYRRGKLLFPFLFYCEPPVICVCGNAKWHGLIAPITDPLWRWFFPPNATGCNCRANQLSEDRMEREGLTVSTAQPLIDDVAMDYRVDWEVELPGAALREINLITF